MSIIDRDLDVFFSHQVAEARRFFFPRKGVGRDAIVVGGGSETVDPKYDVYRKAVPFFAMEFVAAGVGTVELGGKEHRLTPGTVFTYGPGLVHRIRTDPDRPLIKYFVDARPALVDRLLADAGLKPGHACQTCRPAEILQLFDDLIITGQRRGPFSQAICDRLFEAMAYRMVESSVPLGSIEASSFATYRRCLRIIEGEAMQLKSLKDAAARCGMTEAYLCRLFRRYDRLSPYQWLVRIKMNHAAARLRQPRSTVQDVAGQLGYTDAFHFSKVFKRVFGLSPTDFRRDDAAMTDSAAPMKVGQ